MQALYQLSYSPSSLAVPARTMSAALSNATPVYKKLRGSRVPVAVADDHNPVTATPHLARRATTRPVPGN
jgi:hypothetical protein